MRIHYLEVIFKFYTAGYIFSVSMATQIIYDCTRATLKTVFNGVIPWFVFSEASGQTGFDSLGILG